jgi:hypothetical protein
MEKIAIFVEGHAERIFVRDFLMKKHDYSNIKLKCFQLEKDKVPMPAEYDFICQDYTCEYQLTCVGNDDTVIPYILEQEQLLCNTGFTKIIGLRDMYSKQYKKFCPSKQIDSTLNDKFINSAKATIQDNAKTSIPITICFAIMEIEAWFLNLHYVFECIDARLTKEFIAQELGWDIDNECAEQKFFNPANNLEHLYQSIGNKYDKHAGEVEAIMAVLKKEHFEKLYQSDKSPSFRNFVDILKN